MKKAAILVMILTVISKIIAYSKDIVMAYFYGTSSIVDVFVISTTIPILVFTFFGSAVSAGYIPKYNSISKNNDEEAAKRFSTNLINILLCIFLFLIILMMIFTKQIVLLFASGFDQEMLNQTVFFTRIASLTLLTSVPIAIVSTYLQLKKSFWYISLQTVPLNLTVILFIYISSIYGQNIIIFGFLIGAMAQLIVLLPFAVKHKFKYGTYINFTDKDIRTFIIMVAPVFFTIAVNDINQIIDRSLASNLEIGVIGALNYAQKFNVLVQTLLVSSITIVIFPVLTELASSNDMIRFNKKIIESLNVMTLMIVPTTLGLILFAEDITYLFYYRGEFGDDSLKLTSLALLFYSIGMLGFGFRQVLTRAFYALNNYKIPLLNSVISAIINIVLNFLLFYYTNMGIAGLALSTSVAGLLSAVFLLTQLSKQHKDVHFDGFIVTFIKIIMCTIITVSVSFLCKIYFINQIGFTRNVVTLITILISILLYFTLLLFFNISEYKKGLEYLLTKVKLFFKKQFK